MRNQDILRVLSIALVVIFILLLTMIATQPAHAAACHTSAGSGGYWSWRQVDSRRCWYQGARWIAKSQLHWPERERTRKPRLESAPEAPLAPAAYNPNPYGDPSWSRPLSERFEGSFSSFSD